MISITNFTIQYCSAGTISDVHCTYSIIIVHMIIMGNAYVHVTVQGIIHDKITVQYPELNCMIHFIFSIAGMFAGFFYLSLYLAGKLQCFCFSGKTHAWRLLVVMTPLVAGCVVGISRIQDNRHHWEGNNRYIVLQWIITIILIIIQMLQLVV